MNQQYIQRLLQLSKCGRWVIQHHSRRSKISSVMLGWQGCEACIKAGTRVIFVSQMKCKVSKRFNSWNVCWRNYKDGWITGTWVEANSIHLSNAHQVTCMTTPKTRLKWFACCSNFSKTRLDIIRNSRLAQGVSRSTNSHICITWNSRWRLRIDFDISHPASSVISLVTFPKKGCRFLINQISLN